MNAQNAQPNDKENSAVQLLQDINSGIVDARLLDKSNRQVCIELLVAEGYTISQIAQVLKRSEKTISRDLKDIQARNALAPNIEFAKQLIGDVFQKAMNHHSFLVRMARSKDASPAEKIQSEYAAWKILKELVEKLQTLGYLPLKPQEITGDLYHHITTEEGDESIVEVKKMLSEIEIVAKDTDTFTPELAEEINALSKRLEKAEVVSDTKRLMEKQKKQIEEKEEENEE
jgi:DNA-binding CsgD family transcriptional regulator